MSKPKKAHKTPSIGKCRVCGRKVPTMFHNGHPPSTVATKHFVTGGQACNGSSKTIAVVAKS